MNDRIRELAQEAYTYALIHDNSCHGEVYNKKFAELIVRECANIVNSLEQYEGQGDCSTAEYIKERFGVEE